MNTNLENKDSMENNASSSKIRMPPDREVVAQIALDLARLNADPSADDNRAAVRDQIQSHGLSAYFNAAAQTLAAEDLRSAQAAQPKTAVGLEGLALPVLTRDGGKMRQTWSDCIGSRSAQPLRIFHPTTLEELKTIIRQAEAENCRVKAVGSGHSFSDVAGTRDFLIETHGLSKTLPLEPGVLRSGAKPETLFASEAGITFRDLNESLWNAGLGLENMGGYDGQTIAGVISTSTHGSGLAFGPLSSQVVSLTIVGSGGRVIRVEPENGITNPGAWAARHQDIELKQDDDWFNACQVGLGCMGLVYSAVLRVQQRYYLEEQRTLSTWSQVRGELQNGQVLQDNVHYEVLVNPYATKPNGDHTCLVTRRNPTPEPDQPPIILPVRNVLIELAASLPGQSDVLLKVINTFPWFTPNIIDGAMEAIAETYIDRSYRVFNIGKANDVPAFGSEIAFPIHSCLDAVDQILKITGRRQELGQAYLTSPFSLRFVKASPAHMSMMQGTDTCMVELISMDHTVGSKELLQEIETEMYAFGGRPHWGLLNFLSGASGLIESMYPMLPKWQSVRSQLDPKGLFSNAFTERCGLTACTFVRGQSGQSLQSSGRLV